MMTKTTKHNRAGSVPRKHPGAEPECRGSVPPGREETALHSCRVPSVLLIVLWLSVGLMSVRTGAARAADDGAVTMIVELLSGSDDDMRMLALQQIRESVPGADATQRFVALLPSLAPSVQVKLIDALGERGDPAARPAVLKMLHSQDETLRAVAARALAPLASPADVSVLATVAATGSDPEKEAARHGLRHLRGNEMNAAMIAALSRVDAKPKVELMTALIDRNVKASLPVVLDSAEDPELAVRLAVLAALRALGDETYTAAIVQRLKAAQDKTERKQAALALQATCKRGQAKTADAVIAGFKGADAATRILLMRSLPLAGGPKSLRKILACLQDKDEHVRVEAVRVLSGWPDPAAIPHLEELARDVTNQRNQILALRGMVRLAGPGKDRPANLAVLSEAMQLATRKPEKVLVLGTLGRIPTSEALALVVANLDPPGLTEDAGFAAVMIAEKIGGDNKEQVRAVMQQVMRTVRSEKTRAGAQKILEALDSPKPDSVTSAPIRSSS